MSEKEDRGSRDEAQNTNDSLDTAVFDRCRTAIGDGKGADVTGQGKPCGSVGTDVGRGGSVGNDGVPVGVGGSVGAGAVGALVAGGAVGAEVGATDGVEVRVSRVAGGVAAAPGAGDAPCVGVARGAAVAVGEVSPAVGRTPGPRVRLKPTRTRPTASEGPRRTYKVKDARPPWPRAR